MSPRGFPYRILLVEDQTEYIESLRRALDADNKLGESGESHLELTAVAASKDEAIQYLEEDDALPDVLIIDDYLPSRNSTQSQSLETMAALWRIYTEMEIPPHERPRAILWTANDPSLIYSFCVLGGLQYRDKRSSGGARGPVDQIWAALAGRRWQPHPYPRGLNEEQRAALPWLEAGWEQKEITEKLRIPKHIMDSARQAIQDMPRTLDSQRREAPRRWGGRMFSALRANGWVWVPLEYHHLIPNGAPLPRVIDPDAHAESLPAYGPLPKHAQRFLAGDDFSPPT